MSLQSMVEDAKKQGITKLTYNGEVLGLRCTSYTLESGLQYYDFDIDVVRENPKLYKYLQDKYSNFNSLPLLKQNGRYFTQEELDNNLDVRELVDLKQAETVLKPLVNYYRRGYLNV